MIDPVVHAALLTVSAWLIQLLFSAIGLDLGSEVYTALAQFVVAYILSLFGYSLYARAFHKTGLLPDNQQRYVPPFT
jgi:sterol desaturase/sphingolipid hydroxylase (fatty acid hydroxylase superfamily)